MDMKDMLKKEKDLTMDDKLFLDKFKVDSKAHLKLRDSSLCSKCVSKPCLFVCPVGNYQRENGSVSLSWEGCLECGACRIACPHEAIEWKYPQGGYGIRYRHG